MLRSLFLLFCCAATLAMAQDIVTARAGLIYFLQAAEANDALLEGAPIHIKPPADFPVMADGQRLVTRAARVELLLGPAATLWLDQNSQLRMVDGSLESALLELESGTAIIEVIKLMDGARLGLRVGAATLTFRKPGVYGIESNCDGLLRVYGGEVSVNYGSEIAKAENGQEIPLRPGARPVKFDRRRNDEFFRVSAFRSYQLDALTGSRRGSHNWVFAGRGFLTNDFFGETYRTFPGAAVFEFLTRYRAGMLFLNEGQVSILPPGEAAGSTAPSPVRKHDPLSLHLDPGSAVQVDRGRAEILLGQGMVARIGPNAQLRLLDSTVDDAEIEVERGQALIEVARRSIGWSNGSQGSKDARLRVRMGQSLTELRKPGLYRFDAESRSLRVYDGEATANAEDRSLKLKRGQVVEFLAAPRVTKFDVKLQDGLYAWSRQRSLGLYIAGGNVMASWDAGGMPPALYHHAYGKQSGIALRRRGRQP